MTPDQLNTATFAGIVDDLSDVRRDRDGDPYVKFLLNTKKSAELTSPEDTHEQHRCIARGRLAELLKKTVTDGATLLVAGSLFVNSRAARRLDRRIANIVVASASLLRPAPTARQFYAWASQSDPEVDNRFDVRRFARNEVHLVGRVVGVDPNDVLPRLTISTRVPFAATHDVLIWTGAIDDNAVRVGAIVEVEGLLSHHIIPWSDGQIRLVSRVETEDVTIIDQSYRATTVAARVPLRGEPDRDPLRLN